MIPLRRALIVEDKDLTYPEGVACAQVLKSLLHQKQWEQKGGWGGHPVGDRPEEDIITSRQFVARYAIGR